MSKADDPKEIGKPGYDSIIHKVNSVSSQARAKGRLSFQIATHFQRQVPLYTTHICTCCGVPKPLGQYYITYNLACADRIDTHGNLHMTICKACCQKLLMYLYTTRANRNVELAMQYTCAALSVYWDVDLFYTAKKEFEDAGRKNTLLGYYIKTVNEKEPGKTFIDSPFLSDEQYSSKIREGLNNTEKEIPFEWDAQDAQNQKLVLDMVGYDPFELETEQDKRKLNSDLLSVLSDGMENDYIKLQAAINIVQSFFKIRKMTEKQTELERNNAPLSEQKALSDLKSKELLAVSTYAKDNGMSERYANAKAKGELTLTGMMRQMDEKHFEKDIINKYDIETSATIQQAADASFKAIMNQLAFSDSEVWKITHDQFDELTKLRRENAKLAEDLRLAKYDASEAKMKLKELAKGGES